MPKMVPKKENWILPRQLWCKSQQNSLLCMSLSKCFSLLGTHLTWLNHWVIVKIKWDNAYKSTLWWVAYYACSLKVYWVHLLSVPSVPSPGLCTEDIDTFDMAHRQSILRAELSSLSLMVNLTFENEREGAWPYEDPGRDSHLKSVSVDSLVLWAAWGNPHMYPCPGGGGFGSQEVNTP